MQGSGAVSCMGMLNVLSVELSILGVDNGVSSVHTEEGPGDDVDRQRVTRGGVGEKTNSERNASNLELTSMAIFRTQVGVCCNNRTGTPNFPRSTRRGLQYVWQSRRTDRQTQYRC